MMLKMENKSEYILQIKKKVHIFKSTLVLSINVINEKLLFPIVTLYWIIWRIYESHYFNKNLKLKCKKIFYQF